MKLKKVLCALLTMSFLSVTFTGAYAAEPADCAVEAYSSTDSTVAYAVEGGNIYFDTETGNVSKINENVTYANIPSTINGVTVKSIDLTSVGAKCKLKEIYIPDTVKHIDNSKLNIFKAFEKITVSQSNPYFVAQDGILFSKDMTKLLLYPANKAGEYYKIPDTVTSVDIHAFDSEILKTIEISKNVQGTYYPDKTQYYYNNWFGGYNLQSLENFIVDEENTTYSASNGVLFDYDEETLLAYPRSKTSYTYRIPEGISVIEKNAFYYADIQDLRFSSTVEEYTAEPIGNIEYSVDRNNPYFKAKDGVLFSYDMDKIVAYPYNKIGDEYEIPDSVIEICDSAFCMSDLQYIEIPDTVEIIGYGAFEGCEELTEIDLPDSVREIGDSAFEGCEQLTEIYIPQNVERMAYYEPDEEDLLYDGLGEMFDACYQLADITVDEENEYFCDIDGVLFNKDATAILAYPPGREDDYYEIPDGTVYVSATAFETFPEDFAIKIPASVTYISQYGLNYDYISKIYCFKNSTADNAELYSADTEIIYIGEIENNTTIDKSYVSKLLKMIAEDKNSTDYGIKKDYNGDRKFDILDPIAALNDINNK